jgi:hypothetical protein
MDWLGAFWDWWTTSRVTATAAGVGAVVGSITARVGIGTLRHNRKSLQQTTRPMMLAKLVPSGKIQSTLVVENVGPSIARNVRVSFDPPLPTSDTARDGDKSMVPFVNRRFAQVVTAWPPGQVTRNVFHILDGKRDDEGRPTNIDGIPRSTSVKFEYADDTGQTYVDKFSLDPTLIEGETWSHHKHTKNGELVDELDDAPWLKP